MKLYKETEKPLQWKPSVQVRAKELATLNDIKAALAEHGLVAVPPEATRQMMDAAERVEEDGYHAMWTAMIQAVEEPEDETA